MSERAFVERYKEARAAQVSRTMSALVALQSTELSFINVDSSMMQYEVFRNAGLIEEIKPAEILVPGI